MNNRALLIVIAVVLVGIFTIFLVHLSGEKNSNTVAQNASYTSANVGNQIKGN